LFGRHFRDDEAADDGTCNESWEYSHGSGLPTLQLNKPMNRRFDLHGRVLGADDISIECLGRVLFIGQGETTAQSAQSANLS
jgi:hypothetical protein